MKPPPINPTVETKKSTIVELKSVEELKSIHFKQLNTYLKLTNKKLGLLVNCFLLISGYFFTVPRFTAGCL